MSGKDTIGPLIEVMEPGLLAMSAAEVTDELLSEHFEAFGRYCDANTSRFAILVDAGPFLTLSATQRRNLADFEKRLRDHDERYVVGCALHAPNALVRGLMTAVFWLQPPVYPYRFVATREEGIGWLRSQLQPSQDSQ